MSAVIAQSNGVAGAGGRPVDTDQLIAELDQLYQSTLNRLESQTRDAILIDRALRELLEQREDDESVLNWDPERAASPRNVFRALALRLIHEARHRSTRPIEISPTDYEDLLSWIGEPPRNGPSAAEIFLKRIAFARTKTLREFWDLFLLRIAPESNPDAAVATAAAHLCAAWGIESFERVIVPVTRRRGFRTVGMPLRRKPGDIEWVVHHGALMEITRTNHALSTLCVVHGEPVVAANLHELNGNLHNRLKANFRQYKPEERFYAGDDVRLQFNRDHVDFRLSERVFGLVAHILPAHSPGLQFVDTAPAL